jgi:hypothetical protein
LAFWACADVYVDIQKHAMKSRKAGLFLPLGLWGLASLFKAMLFLFMIFTIGINSLILT